MRWLHWLSRIMVQTVVIAGLTLYLTWMTVHTYMDDLLKRYHLYSEEDRLQFSDFLANLSKQLQQAAGTPGRGTDRGPSDGGLFPETNGGRPNAGEAGGSGLAEADRSGTADDSVGDVELPGAGMPENAYPVWTPIDEADEPSGDPSGRTEEEETAGGDADRKLVLTEEQFEAQKERLSDQAKAKIFTILLGALTQEEWEQLSVYMEGGITVGEMEAIDALLRERVEQEQYEELLAILDELDR